MVEPAIAPKSARRAPTALSPFRFGMFRAVWIGMLSANFGQWVQSVGAAWLMTLIAPSPDMVALVQAASALPTLAFALFGGVGAVRPARPPDAVAPALPHLRPRQRRGAAPRRLSVAGRRPRAARGDPR